MSAAAGPESIELTGELDLSTADALEARLAGIKHAAFIVIDLRRVTYLDSLAIAQLMRAHASAAAHGGAIALVSSDQRIAQVLSIAGLTRVARMFDTPELAREFLAQLAPYVTSAGRKPFQQAS